MPKDTRSCMPKRNQKQGLQFKKILTLFGSILENRRFTDNLENDISTLGDVYPLDYRKVVDFIKEQCIIITGNPVIEGVAIINNDFWKRINPLQIVYLDSQNISPLQDLVSFVINLYLTSINKTHLLHEENPLQILTFQTEHLAHTMRRLNFGEPEQFLLYSKKI